MQHHVLLTDLTFKHSGNLDCSQLSLRELVIAVLLIPIGCVGERAGTLAARLWQDREDGLLVQGVSLHGDVSRTLRCRGNPRLRPPAEF
jgi:hypothetical protein